MRVKPVTRAKRKRGATKPRANRLLEQLKEQVDDAGTEMADAEIKSVKGSVKTNAVDTAKLDITDEEANGNDDAVYAQKSERQGNNIGIINQIQNGFDERSKSAMGPTVN